MIETDFWDTMRPVLTHLGLDPVRVENVLGAGTPDVNYTAGWIELKHMDAWPSRAASPVIIQTLKERPEQVAWLTRRWWAYAPAYLMVRIGQDIMLFDGVTSRAVRNGMTRTELVAAACWRTELSWDSWEVTGRRLKAWLTFSQDDMTPCDRVRFHRLLTRKPVEDIAAELGWMVSDVLTAEFLYSTRTDDLLSYWES